MNKLRIFLFVLIVIGIILLCTQNFWVPQLVDKILSFESSDKDTIISPQKSEKPAKAEAPVSIATREIKEKNFTGTVPVISGTSSLEVKMREYVEGELAKFKKQADEEVPDLRERFGSEGPTASYEISIYSKYIKSEKTKSIVTHVIFYTGGAHPWTIYKVFTADNISGKILQLSYIIRQDKRGAFVEFVKKNLGEWRIEDEYPATFPESVKDLTFESFSNWSLDDKNLTIYFDQYDIGPGALGPVAFPIQLDKIRDYLQ